ALDRGARNLTDAVREAVASVGPPPQSVFGAVEGGYAVLVDELVRRAGIRWTQVTIEQVNRAQPGWELVDDEGQRWHADAAVLAVPAPRLPTLIDGVAPRTASAARRIAVASTALVALALPGGTPLPEQSGGPGGNGRATARQGDYVVEPQMGAAWQRGTGAVVLRPVRRLHRNQRSPQRR